ncbi:MAG: hypothetical protein OXQ93_13385 [Gemmatimonadota bacterium]|nr:hypothetical protein [Gemmatimonadota bacterium]
MRAGVRPPTVEGPAGPTPRRRGSRGLVPALLTLVPIVLACGEEPEPLLGEWVSVAAETGQMTYIFEGDGQSRWVLELETGPDTFAVAYRVDYSRNPIHLDVGPWSTGPIAGRTLYGIVGMRGPDRFVVDFEPADPDGDGTARPSSFSNQSVTFVRKVN